MTRVKVFLAIFLAFVSIAGLAILRLAQSPVGEKSESLTGVNIASAAFGADHVPGIFGQDYIYPEPSSIDYYAAKGMNIIRLPVLWERLQHHLGENLDESEMQRIDGVVTYATSKGLKIIIDVHNYAKYFGAVIGMPELPPTALGDL